MNTLTPQAVYGFLMQQLFDRPPLGWEATDSKEIGGPKVGVERCVAADRSRFKAGICSVVANVISGSQAAIDEKNPKCSPRISNSRDEQITRCH